MFYSSSSEEAGKRQRHGFTNSSLLPVTIDPVKAVSVFRSQRGELSTIICNDLANIANKLYADFIISQKTLDEAINSSLNKGDRTVALLSAIEAKLEVQPSDFTKLVDILDSEPYLSTLAEGLVHSYNTSCKFNNNYTAHAHLISDLCRKCSLGIFIQ